ncbi:cytochrome P460 family protein [Halioxenophilus aromaticivorans]
MPGKLPALLTSLAFVLVNAVLPNISIAEENRVTFPANIDKLVHYTTVTRGEVEEILTTQEAIDAVANNQPIPYGTHVVIRFHRDREITRYFVMQKGRGWGQDYPNGRTKDWQFQFYNADQSIKLEENTQRCQSCHARRASDQFIYTFDELKDFQ